MARRRIPIRLDEANETEKRILDAIAPLKQKKQWAKTVRIGLSIMLELMDGRTDTLVREFPEIAQQLAMEALQRAGFQGEGALIPITKGAYDELTLQLNRLEAKLLNGGVQVASEMGSRPLVAMKVDDTDERLNLTVEQSKSNQNTSMNLQITTTLAMNQNGYLWLPLETLEYGLAMGDLGITEAMVAEKRAMMAEKGQAVKVVKPKAVKAVEGSAKAMDAPMDLGIPTFDDVEIEW